MWDFPASRVSFPVVLGWEGLGPQLNLCPLMGRAHYLEVQLYLNLITRRVCWEWAIHLCDYSIVLHKNPEFGRFTVLFCSRGLSYNYVTRYAVS